MRNQTAQILKIRNYTDNKSKIIKSLLKKNKPKPFVLFS